MTGCIAPREVAVFRMKDDVERRASTFKAGAVLGVPLYYRCCTAVECAGVGRDLYLPGT